MRTMLVFKHHLSTPSDKLDNLVMAARTVRDVSDLASFPYVRVAASLVLQILEIVQAARKNKEDFEELAESLVQIVVIMRDTLRTYSKNFLPPSDFTAHCQNFTDKLLDMMAELNDVVRHTQSWVRFLKTTTIRDTISQYRRQIDNLRSNFTLTTMMHMSLKIFAEQRPRDLGYTWEFSEPLRFIDAMNVAIQLPMDLCSTPTDFEDLLKFLFRKRRGRRYVENGHYALTHGDKESLEHGLWRSVVKPGITIRMNIILKSETHDLDTTEHHCPSCKHLCVDAAVELEEVTCSSCEALFRVSRAALESTLTPHVAQIKPFAADTIDILFTSPLWDEDEAEDLDIKYFRRFHVLLAEQKQDDALPLLMHMWWAYPLHEFDANYLEGETSFDQDFDAWNMENHDACKALLEYPNSSYSSY